MVNVIDGFCCVGLGNATKFPNGLPFVPSHFRLVVGTPIWQKAEILRNLGKENVAMNAEVNIIGACAYTRADRLDSWKEIAAYLNRTERTVSRWERRGLPVYRVPGGQNQSVFAYKHEID